LDFACNDGIAFWAMPSIGAGNMGCVFDFSNSDILTAAATMAAAIVGGVSVWYVNREVEQRREASEREQQVLKALEFLVGGTQKRSAGLGILEGFFLRRTKSATGDGFEFKKELGLRDTFLPVIRNQLIYLRTSNKEKSELHEHDNFVRLLNIWIAMHPTDDENEPIRIAIDSHRPALSDQGEPRGLALSGNYVRYKDRLDEVIRPKSSSGPSSVSGGASGP
jgi:hypothetical protein